MSAHSSGPWSAPYIDDENNSRQFWVVDEDGGLVAEVGDESPGGNERALGFARLIAAAPELLEALIHLHAVARVDRDEDYGAVTNAAAVIHKATGAAS